MASRLLELDTTIARVIEIYRPDFGVVEEIFVNVNPQSTLKLGQARGRLFCLWRAPGCRCRNILPKW
jgi:Holliday junction resolvasome RuvABC endonuclease subunit